MRGQLQQASRPDRRSIVVDARDGRGLSSERVPPEDSIRG